MKATVSLYIRIRTADDRWTYARTVTNANGRLRTLYAQVDGKPVHRPEGVYQLRYTVNEKRTWQPVGSDASLAQVALERKSCELRAGACGLSLPEPAVAVARPVGVEGPPKRLLADCIATYNAEIREHKAQRSFAAYSKTLGLFVEVVQKKFIEDISREDVLAYISVLRKRGNQPRTVRNRIEWTTYRNFTSSAAYPSCPCCRGAR